MKANANGASTGIKSMKGALTGMGLAAAITFTIGQLIGLKDAVNDYRSAMKSLNNLNEDLLDKQKTLSATQTDNQNLAQSVAYLNSMIANEKEIAKMKKEWYKPTALELKVLEKEQEQNIKLLKEQGTVIDENSNLYDELAKAQRKQQEERKKVHDANAGRRESEKEAAQAKKDAAIAEIDNVNNLTWAIKAQAKVYEEISGKKYALPGDLSEQDAEKLKATLAEVNSAVLALHTQRIDEIQADTESANQALLEAQRALDLSKTESAEEYYALQRQYEQEDYDAKVAAIRQEIMLYASKGEALTEIERVKMEELQKLALSYSELFKVEKIALADEEKTAVAEDHAENKENARIEYEDRLAQAQEFYSKYDTLTSGLGSLLGNTMAGAREKNKEVMKGMLLDLVGFVERKVMAAILASSAQGLLTGGLSMLKDLPQIIAVKGLAAALKGKIASYDTGGYSQDPGVYYAGINEAHIPTDKDSAIGNDLADRISDKMGGGGDTTVVLEMDGQKMGQAQISHVNNRNKKLPRGRSVYDESVG